MATVEGRGSRIERSAPRRQPESIIAVSCRYGGATLFPLRHGMSLESQDHFERLEIVFFAL